MIRINSINYHGSVCDGPGLRVVIFFQGCIRKCEGCHNPCTWDTNGGMKIDEYVLIDEIKSNTQIKRITISGGEPLLQREGLNVLLKALYQEEYDIALYTGFEYEEVPREIFRYLKYLKTGAYINSQRLTTGYYGSSNQKFTEIG